MAIATETANQGQAVSKIESDFSNLNTAHKQLQTDFNELKNKLDSEHDQEPRPTSGNSKFTETVDC